VYWLSMYSAVLGRTQPAARAAASAITHWLFCGTPCADRSQRRAHLLRRAAALEARALEALGC